MVTNIATVMIQSLIYSFSSCVEILPFALNQLISKYNKCSHQTFIAIDWLSFFPSVCDLLAPANELFY